MTSHDAPRRRLYGPVYLLVALSLMVGGSLVGFYEAFAMTDFGRVVSAVRANAELFGIENLDDEEAMERRGALIESRLEEALVSDVRRSERSYAPLWAIPLVWAALALWLRPVYRHPPGAPVSARVEQRILTLPTVILLIPWVFGGIALIARVLGRSAATDPSIWGLVVSLASFLMYGALVGQFNVSITLPYITRSMADHLFQGSDRYRPKQGRSITITGRVQLLIVSVALLPILLIISTPVIFNWWAIEEARRAAAPDVLQLARTFLPVAVMTLIGLYFLIVQVISLVSFRTAIQRPLDTLIERMTAVAGGDFSSRTSVLAGDEIGRLKGHFNQMVEGLEEREKIRDTFGRYVSMEIAEKLMSGGSVDLGGEEIVTTVMFADIRDFTRLSESMSPRALVDFLNEYFSFVVRPITAHQGVVNKFIGDSVMAVFSPVFGVTRHAEAAVRAAIGMREALQAFNATGRYQPIRQGVGVHTGVLVAGTVGAEDRREYTVIGDTVNVASRIESQTKVLGTDILVSGDAVAELAPVTRRSLALSETDSVTMRGTSRPTRLFVVGDVPAP